MGRTPHGLPHTGTRTTVHQPRVTVGITTASPTGAEQQAGVDPLVRLIELLPRLRVVFLQGNDAKDTWRRVLVRYPDDRADPRIDDGGYLPSRTASAVIARSCRPREAHTTPLQRPTRR